MTKYLKIYEQIMADYTAGKYGHFLSFGEILEKGGAPNLLKEMNSADL